jgi:hypothetical protein
VRPDGVTSFSMIEAAFESGNAAALVYFLFDLLYLDGEDLCALPSCASISARNARPSANSTSSGGMRLEDAVGEHKSWAEAGSVIPVDSHKAPAAEALGQRIIVASSTAGILAQLQLARELETDWYDDREERTR